MNKEELAQLHVRLERLITYHLADLEAEHVSKDVERILRWIERCEEGSATAERCLYEEGMAVLENVNARLKLALEEQMRIVEESPTVASTARGRKTARYAKVSSKTSDALATLSALNGSLS